MSETRKAAPIRRILLPLLIAAALVVVTVLFSGSALIRIEDVVANRILAGTYGTPDWRIQEMNPLLAQCLTLLYRILPSVNWYGALLLALLALSAATAISLAARGRGGFWPGVVVISPIVVLMANSMVSTAVCALCAASGAFVLMDGLARRKDGVASTVWGAILFALAAMLSLPWAILVGIGAAICWLPNALRDSRMRGLAIGLPVMAIVLLALFGYSSLMFNTPELAAYRADYARYERLQHSSLKGEAEALLAEYGVHAYSAEHADEMEEVDVDTLTEEDVATPEVPESSFDAVDWTLNDASMFFSRYSSDTKLTDPETLKVLEKQASFWNFTPRHLGGGLLETVKKPQFLLLIGLFVLSALAVIITSRRRGLLLVLAAVIALGGHVLSIARYHDAFSDIAPFYLLAIVIMLFSFDGESALGWYRRVVAAPALRIALDALVLVGLVAVLGGMLYYTSITPANPGQAVVQAVTFLKPYIAEHQDMLLIGENPNERYKPQTLDVPAAGEDRTLLAGSYDLYSPRRAALMEQFGIENPLPDSIGREDIAYVLMGFSEPVALRLATEYGIYTKEPNVLHGMTGLSESVIQMQAFSQAEVDALLAESAWQANVDDEAIAELNRIIEEAIAAGTITVEDDHDHAEEDDHDHAAEEEHDHAEGEEHDHVDATPAPSAAPNPAGNG